MVSRRGDSFADNVVVAHRGAWKMNNLPENSIAALRQAIALGCTGAEFDVWMTADDSLVVNHDAHFNKLAIEQTNYADLLTFKLSNGEKLPTLREYIQAGMRDNSSTRLVCEIKPSTVSKERGKAVAGRAVKLIQELGAQDRVVYITFDYDMILHIHSLVPEVPAQYLNGDKSPEELRAAGIQGADYHFSVFKKHPEWVAQAKENGIVLNAWTVNEVADMDRLLAQGFEYITTNEPELLLERIRIHKNTTR
ncbi:glycerophosphodiester phosphodiesterase [Persicitalea jodogahamensis]|uniref:Glycerophosphoryl diester phosphodiesterase n=1 Tax=Persicitalea jodogahamensis TaxID=402147 RepID=A0A8J3GA68_9BACT|nr:glycerophosphodiester phosphodiesterase family protein [Persicitalea jodogahamensis]GHB78578.1 glycerophosphoryl diester phosphodiesterase [Persicitalea jodogahamensis]